MKKETGSPREGREERNRVVAGMVAGGSKRGKGKKMEGEGGCSSTKELAAAAANREREK